MVNWFFRWMNLSSRDLKVTIFRQAFSVPDASRDVCQVTDCGIMRGEHGGKNHKFMEAL
mgnify:CR=1 FL=1